MSSCSWNRRNPPPDDEADDKEADTCAICLMPMKDDEVKRAPTKCGLHLFHVGCLCSHYETSYQGGCPVCRKGQRGYLSDDDESDNEGSVSYWVPGQVPFPMVRRVIKANPRTKNMAKTLTKNEKELTVAKRICKAKMQSLLALRSKVADQIASNRRKAWKRFDKKNKTLFEEVGKLIVEKNKIHRRVLSSKQRMRAKYATSEA